MYLMPIHAPSAERNLIGTEYNMSFSQTGFRLIGAPLAVGMRPCTTQERRSGSILITFLKANIARSVDFAQTNIA
jgi:hypothetical protein